MSYHSNLGRLWANIQADATTDNENQETLSGTTNETPSGNTSSRCTDSSATTRAMPSGIQFNNLAHKVNTYTGNSNAVYSSSFIPTRNIGDRKAIASTMQPNCEVQHDDIPLYINMY